MANDNSSPSGSSADGRAVTPMLLVHDSANDSWRRTSSPDSDSFSPLEFSEHSSTNTSWHTNSSMSSQAQEDNAQAVLAEPNDRLRSLRSYRGGQC